MGSRRVMWLPQLTHSLLQDVRWCVCCWVMVYTPFTELDRSAFITMSDVMCWLFIKMNRAVFPFSSLQQHSLQKTSRQQWRNMEFLLWTIFPTPSHCPVSLSSLDLRVFPSLHHSYLSRLLSSHVWAKRLQLSVHSRARRALSCRLIIQRRVASQLCLCASRRCSLLAPDMTEL